jgi:phage tail sheath protein FI
MPVTPTYPGIYIQEAPGGPPAIVAAQTNVGLFIGYPHPLKTLAFNTPVLISGFADYQRLFGGFIRSVAYANAFDSTNVPGAFADLPTGVSQFFQNGGTQTYVVGLINDQVQTLAPVTVNVNGIVFTAREVTDEKFTMTVSVRPSGATAPGLADIIVTYGPTAAPATSPPTSPPPAIQAGAATVVETYRRVSLTQTSPQFIETVIGTTANPVSSLVTVSAGAGAFPSTAQTLVFPIFLHGSTQFFAPGDFTAVMEENTPLDKLPNAGDPPFNIMVIPGVSDSTLTGGDGSGKSVLAIAVSFCERKLAFLVMDPPAGATADGTPPTFGDAIGQTLPLLPISKNAALYFPYLLSPDPFTGGPNNSVTGEPNSIPPAATVAGIYSATDLARGVWKAPAGFQATTNNTNGVVPTGRMTDIQQGTLNPIGVNCLRDFPNLPTIVFGARTLAVNNDQQWTYVSVRRMALFIEMSLYNNLKWVIFEPNAEPLWNAITTTINPFMLGLFRQGAFAGTTPSQSFQVQCDSQTTTPTDQELGIVNIVVSFAPLRPAEFVIITIAQMTGQAQT